MRREQAALLELSVLRRLTEQLLLRIDATERILAQSNSPEPTSLDLLRLLCWERGTRVTADDWFVETAAAELLGRAPSTLRTCRAEERAPVWRKRSDRVEYLLEAIAEHLTTGDREEF